MPPENNKQGVKPADVPNLDVNRINYNNWKLRIGKWCIISKVKICEQGLAV